MCFVSAPFLAHNTAIRIGFYGGTSFANVGEVALFIFPQSTMLSLSARPHSRRRVLGRAREWRSITFNMKEDKIKERTRRNYKEEGDADDRHSSSWPSFSTVVVGCPREYEELSRDKSKMA